MPTASSPPRRGLPRAFVAFAVAAGLVAAAWAALSLASLASRSTERTTTTYVAAGLLRIDTGSGDVTIVAEDRTDVRVVTEVRHGIWRPHVTQGLRDGRLELTGDCDFWAEIGIDSCRTSFEVRVPLATRIVVDASSGDLAVSGARADVSLHASSGDIHARDVSGLLELDSSSGDVEVDGYRGMRLDAHTSSGDVEVRSLRAPRRLVADTSSGDVRVVVPDGTYRVAASTDSGDEDIQVGNDPYARNVIEATTSSGDVTVAGLGN